MKKIFILLAACVMAYAAMLTSCGGSGLTQEQRDSIARAIGPDTILAKVKDAKYAAVKFPGICGPDTIQLFVQSYDGRIFSTNVCRIGDMWGEGVMPQAENLLNDLTDDTWAELTDSVFTPTAIALQPLEMTLSDLVLSISESTEKTIAHLNDLANSIYKGYWRGLVGGNLAAQLATGMSLFQARYNIGITHVTSVQITPLDLSEGRFNVVTNIMHELNPDCPEYWVERGEVKFVKENGQYIMVSSTNVCWSAAQAG